MFGRVLEEARVAYMLEKFPFYPLFHYLKERLFMQMSRFSLLLAVLLPVASVPAALAQAGSTPNSYDPRVTFAPLTLPEPVNVYRSSNGAPGPS